MNDEQLIASLRAGSREAMELLYDRHKDGLFTLAKGLLGDASAAEDVVHDVFVSFVESLEKYHVNGGLRPYLATAVANRARDRLRSARRRALKSDPEDDADRSATPPELAVMQNEETQRLRQALLQLPYEQREVLMLHLQSGLTFKQIGIIQGVSLSTAQGRYRYGLDKLRSLLTEG